MPRKGIKFRAPPVAVRLHESEFSFAVNLAESMGLTISDIVRMAVVEFRKTHGKPPVLPVE
jgi:antitoxin component of RelBE/YafQ-DinJ toxin-antitoxin module